MSQATHSVVDLLLLIIVTFTLQSRATEPDDISAELCSFLQTDFRLSGISASATSVASRSDMTGNATSEVETVELVPSSVQDMKSSRPQMVSLWPAVLLVTGTVGSFLAMVIFGHLAFPRTEETPGMQVKCRESFGDHAKFLLSAGVCFAHLTMKYADLKMPWGSIWQELGLWSHPSNQFMSFLHLFMMQTFCFYSGHYSRSYTQQQQSDTGRLGVYVSNPKLQGTILKILLVGEIMHIVVQALQRAMDGLPLLQLPRALLDCFPGASWYIYALTMWRLILPFWTCLQYPIAASFLIALVPCSHALPIGISRCLAYFPFFVMGWRLDPSILRKTCSDRRLQVSGLAFLALVLFALRWPTLYPYLVTLSNYHGEYASSFIGGDYYGILRPTVYYTVSSLCMASFLAGGQLVLAGNWGPLIDNMCQRSIYNYLGHMVVLHGLNIASNWQQYMLSLAPTWQLVFSLSMALLTLMIMTSWPVYFLCSSVCEPNLAWLFVSANVAADEETCRQRAADT